MQFTKGDLIRTTHPTWLPRPPSGARRSDWTFEVIGGDDRRLICLEIHSRKRAAVRVDRVEKVLDAKWGVVR